MHRLFAAAVVLPVLLLGFRPVSAFAGQPGCSAQATLSPVELRGLALLREQIVLLSPKVSPDEAARVASRAYLAAAQLRNDYRVTGPPLFHNFLVNIGARKRGLCFQWAEDLLAQLDRLQLTSLELHWGEARAGTQREHNCVVVTAKGQLFSSGIVLDSWRHSGHLYWASVAQDHYPWVEDKNYAQVARSKAVDHHLAFQTPITAAKP